MGEEQVTTMVVECRNQMRKKLSRAWDKEKLWVPYKNRTHDLSHIGRIL